MESSCAKSCLMLIWLIGLNDHLAKGSERVFGNCYNGESQFKAKRENLTGVCSPWMKNSCCSEESASAIEKMYEENYCSKQMSLKCREKFQRVNCFRECSPNLGLWALNNTNSDSRFQFVPLSLFECQSWWNDCKNELTCFENRTANLHWEDKHGMCTSKENCKAIKDIYTDATFFCEHVLGPFDFLVVKNEDPFLSLFGETRENENAAKYISQTMRDEGRVKLYEIVYKPVGRSIYPRESLELRNNSDDDKDKMQFIMLSFVLGAITAVLGIIAGCCILNKWRSNVRRTTSLQYLCSHDGNTSRETGSTI